MISVPLFAGLLLSTFTSTDGFLVSKPYAKTNSRARTSIQIESSATDFVEPPNPLKTVNFGDPIHSYWGREAFEKTFGVPYVLAPDVYEVSLPKPLGIVFEEILPNAPKGVRVASLVEGGNAEASLISIGIGDVLVGVTGVTLKGAKHERQLVPA